MRSWPRLWRATSEEPPPSAATDPLARDALVEAIADAIAPADMAAIGWTVNKLYELAEGMGLATLQTGQWVCVRAVTPLAKWKRGRLTDGAVPAAGDILLYQAKGNTVEIGASPSLMLLWVCSAPK